MIISRGTLDDYSNTPEIIKAWIIKGHQVHQRLDMITWQQLYYPSVLLVFTRDERNAIFFSQQRVFSSRQNLFAIFRTFFECFHNKSTTFFYCRHFPIVEIFSDANNNDTNITTVVGPRRWSEHGMGCLLLLEQLGYHKLCRGECIRKVREKLLDSM